jgi:rRNA-processing protein FCF1
MRRVVLDSNAIDPIADTPGTYETVRAAIDAGHLDVMFTHITIEELANIQDYDRRCRLLLLVIDLGRLVPTGSTVLDVSRFNFARYGDDAIDIEALRSKNIDHSRDALIAATAIFEHAALVTNERRLTGRAREHGVEVLTTSQLLAELDSGPPR